MTINEEITMFTELTKAMSDTFAKKRHDYGQTTEETYKKFGPVSMLTRMHDKMGRLDTLLVSGDRNYVEDEKVEDTLLDLANYALITILEMRKAETHRIEVLKTERYKSEIGYTQMLGANQK